MCRTSPKPFCWRSCNSYSPGLSEKYAIHLPSGDHAGSRSATAGLWATLRISPLSVGTVPSTAYSCGGGTVAEHATFTEPGWEKKKGVGCTPQGGVMSVEFAREFCIPVDSGGADTHLGVVAPPR